MCFERYLSVVIKNWRNLHFNSKKAAIICLVIISVIFSLNIHLAGTLNYQLRPNKTLSGTCNAAKMSQMWRTVSLFVFRKIKFHLKAVFIQIFLSYIPLCHNTIWIDINY